MATLPRNLENLIPNYPGILSFAKPLASMSRMDERGMVNIIPVSNVNHFVSTQQPLLCVDEMFRFFSWLNVGKVPLGPKNERDETRVFLYF